jgi:hypothetical protein
MNDLEKLAEEAREALQRAVFEALDQKRELGQYAVVYEDDRVLHIGPEEIEKRIAPLRKRYGLAGEDAGRSEPAAPFEVRESEPDGDEDEAQGVSDK